MIALPPAADATRLTAALRAAGVLGTARVVDVAAMALPIKKLRSHTFRLRLDYEGPAGDAPGTIILKTGHLDDAGRPAYPNLRETASTATSVRLCPKGWCRAALR